MSEMNPRESRTVRLYVTVGLTLLGAVIASCLVYALLYYSPTEGSERTQSTSPGSVWVAEQSVTSRGAWLQEQHGLVQVHKVDGTGSDANAYFGPLATVKWLSDDRLAVTEVESGARHVLQLPSDRYDYRVDRLPNLLWGIAMVALPGIFILGLGALGIRKLRHGRSPMRRPPGA
jgi:hypothetical protein